MRYIKKIDSIPLVDGGKVVNSFATNDDHKTNAPSMAAVENRDDNNLLFNGWFCNTSNDLPLGWTFTKTSPGSYISSAGPYGVVIGNTVEGGIRTPRYYNVANVVESDFCISVTVCFSIGQSDPLTGRTVVCENVISSDTERVIVDEDGFLMRFAGVIIGGCTGFYIKNVSGQSVFIHGIKIETGKKASKFITYSKDAEITNLIKDKMDLPTDHLLPNETDLNTFFDDIDKCGYWMIDSDHYTYYNLPEGYEGNGFLEVTGCNIRRNGSASFPIDFMQIVYDRYCRTMYVRRGYYSMNTDTYVWLDWEKYYSSPAVKTKKFQAPPYTFQANYGRAIRGVVDDPTFAAEGYVPKAFAGIFPISENGGYVLTGGFHIFKDSDGQYKADVMFYNPLDTPSTVSIQWEIIYVKE